MRFERITSAFPISLFSLGSLLASSLALLTTASPAAAEVEIVRETPPRERGDVYVVDRERGRAPAVKGGLGLNVFGAAGSRDSTKLGVGGRVEVVVPLGAVGLAVGGSFTQFYGGAGDSYDQTRIRPLLGEAGVALAATRGFEIRPMIGIGYTWVDVSTNGTANDQNARATGSIVTSGFDVAPGAKFSFVGGGFEVFALPKYNVMRGGPDFLAVEVGGGARF